MISWMMAVTSAQGAAFVLKAELRPLTRAVRAAQRAEPRRVVALGTHEVCVEIDDPQPRDVLRIARRLGHPPEARADCDVAWFPLGRGWIALVVDTPSDGLNDAVESLSIPAVQIRRRVGDDGPATVCGTVAAIPDPNAVADHLEARGLAVRAMYEVGGCDRR